MFKSFNEVVGSDRLPQHLEMASELEGNNVLSFGDQLMSIPITQTTY
jgi:hypothetical protein